MKRGDLNAQVASVAGIRTVLHQVEQVLDHTITDPLTSDQAIVRECWVVTNGEIPRHAIDEVAHTLRRHHLDRAVRWIDAAALARLLCQRLRRATLETMLDLGTADPGKEGSDG